MVNPTRLWVSFVLHSVQIIPHHMSYYYPWDNRKDHIVADKNNRRQACDVLLVMVFCDRGSIHTQYASNIGIVEGVDDEKRTEVNQSFATFQSRLKKQTPELNLHIFRYDTLSEGWLNWTRVITCIKFRPTSINDTRRFQGITSLLGFAFVYPIRLIPMPGRYHSELNRGVGS